MTPFEIFVACPPGLEPLLAAEATEAGFADVAPLPGGVTFVGGWPDVWRANLTLRGGSKVLARIAEFRALHLAQLDKRARKLPWGDWLRADVPVRVEATCKRSRIYHAGAATQRIERAITDTLGAPIAKDAGLCLRLRIEDDMCTLSLDSSGAPLHQRGHKQAVGKAPMRENLAALFLRACGFDGTEPVLDPMCGSGTFVIEAAEIAAGLRPGRSRRFAFEDLAGFDATAWTQMRSAPPPPARDFRAYGADRDTGAIANSTRNAAQAGVEALTQFSPGPISALDRPEGPPGLVIINPPYGGRIGAKKQLFALHGALGQVLRERFSGWRVGLITNEAPLARATELPFAAPSAPIPHGGLRVKLWQTGPLP